MIELMKWKLKKKDEQTWQTFSSKITKKKEGRQEFTSYTSIEKMAKGFQ